MKYPTDKKGQGFDTFKLLIAAVVAMVILGIVTGVFTKIWNMITGISCMSNPIGEITSKIQQATTGMVVVTQTLCFSAGESIQAVKIREKTSSVSQVTFQCGGASVCESGYGAIEVTGDSISAKRDAQFKVKISCSADASNNFQCTLTVINPTSNQ